MRRDELVRPTRNRARCVGLASRRVSAIGMVALAAVVVWSGPLRSSQGEVGPPAEWDLDSLYPSQEAWDAEAAHVRSRLASIFERRGHTLDTAESLADLLDLVSDARGRAGRMAKVGVLQAEVDTTSSNAAARREEALALEATVESQVAFLADAVLAIDPDRIDEWLRSDPRVGRHGRRLRRIRFEGRFTRGASQSATAQLARLSRTAADAYGALMSSDLQWPALDTNAGIVALDPTTHARLARDASRAVRHAANERFLSHLRRFESLAGMLLTRRVEGDLALARAAGLDDPVDRLFVLADGLPPQAYRRMFEVAQRGKTVFTRVFRALARAQGLTTLSLDDVHAQLATPRIYTYSESVDLAVAGAAPLGAAYQAQLRQRLAAPWIHARPDAHKSGTVGAYWQVGGGHPHVLLSFRGRHSNSRTLSAAAALMMAYASIPDEAAPDRREEDLPVFGNALWYLGQLAHDDTLLQRAKTRGERVGLLAEQIYVVWNVYARWSLAAQFETEIGRRVAAGRPPGGAELSAYYMSLLREYFGGPGGVEIAPYFGTEWMTFDTMFYGPHQLTFPAAMAAAVALRSRIALGDAAALDTVRQGLARSETHYSHDVLKGAGIDLSTSAPYEHVLDHLGSLAARLERELASEP